MIRECRWLVARRRIPGYPELLVRRIVLTALALMVLLPSVAFARSEYVCRFDGQQRESCCCPEAQRHELPAASLKAACCCTVVKVAPARGNAATADGPRDLRSQLAAAVAVLPVPIAPLRSAEVLAPRPRAIAPPLGGLALFVRHCALLL